MAKTQTLPGNLAEHPPEMEEDVVAYPEAAEENDPDLMADVLDVIERARGMRRLPQNGSEQGESPLGLRYRKALHTPPPSGLHSQ